MSEGEATAVVRLRELRDDDYLTVANRLDEWWGGREMTAMLPRLFFQHFQPTSFAAVDDSGPICGFLCGFVSQTDPTMAYIHFVGVDPAARAHGIGSMLYEAFFAAARARGCKSVSCVTAPVNVASQRFHERLGFSLSLKDDYDGPGVPRYVMRRAL